jgi:hypothetical protein
MKSSYVLKAERYGRRVVRGAPYEPAEARILAEAAWLAGYRAATRDTRKTIAENVTILRNHYLKVLTEQRDYARREGEAALRAATIAAQNYQTLLVAKRALEDEVSRLHAQAFGK